MRSILATAQRARLAELARPDTLFAFDFDGTLAPIVADPRRARLRASTRELLARLAELRPCAVISGRSLADLAPRVHGLELRLCVGNHGAEWPGRATRSSGKRVRAWREQLDESLAGVDGVVVEDKGSSLAVHYRGARDRRSAERRVNAEASTLDAARLVAGKCVVNVVPADAAHKGHALRDACLQLGCPAALFVGDDVTDEDAFAMPPPPRLLSVRVGRSARSHADYYLRGQDDMDALLRRLLELSSAGGGRRAAKIAKVRSRR